MQHHQLPNTSMYYLRSELVDRICIRRNANFLLSIHQHTGHILKILAVFLFPSEFRNRGLSSITYSTQVWLDNLTKSAMLSALVPLKSISVLQTMCFHRTLPRQAIKKVK